jgi:hypothetical protein
MGKQQRLSKATIRRVRKKIRAEVRRNRDLQEVVDRHLDMAGIAGESRQARAARNRSIYSSLIRDNRMLSERARAIFDSMKPRS